jgi:hypothetical protein
MPRLRRTRRKGRRSRNRKHKQRGGATIAKPFTEWVQALKDSGLIGSAAETGLRRPELAIPAPTDQNEEFMIPELRIEDGRLMDYRVLAGQMAVVMGNQDDFIARFNAVDDPVSLKHLLRYENALRQQVGQNDIGDIRDPANFPLMIWILAQNYEGDLDNVQPALTPPSEVESIIRELSSKATEPASSEPTQLSP